MDKKEKVDDKINELLLNLSNNEEFISWRDQVCKPILDEIDMMKQNILVMTEGEAKSVVMYENLVKKLFYKTFEDVKLIERNEDGKS
jgi:hypothetical protein